MSTGTTPRPLRGPLRAGPWTTIGAIVLLIVVVVGVTMVSDRVLRRARWDATQGSIYTLTEGSRRIARSPSEPVTLTMYYSAKLARGNPQIETYAKRVREVLEEYARESEGKVLVRTIDPEPSSEQEDEAVAAGLRGVPAGPAGELFFFGVLGTNSIDTREVMPFLSPERERLLEYDLSRMVTSLATPRKRVLGYLSSLQLEGGFRINPRTRQPEQTPPYRAIEELKSIYDVRNLAQGGLESLVVIPADVDVLMIAHPKDLPEHVLYAIDQFVLAGGRTIMLVDPLCESDVPLSTGMPDYAAMSSDLSRLLNAWGVSVPNGQLAADQEIALAVQAGQGGERVPYVVWLEMREGSLAKDDPVTAQARVINLASSGIIEATKDMPEGVPRATISPLLTTTKAASRVETQTLPFPPDPRALFAAFVPGNETLTLAARLGGRVQSASDTPPTNPDGSAIASQGPHRASSEGEISVLLFADADILSDALWVREVQILPGVPAVQRLADNGDLIAGAVDSLAGSKDLATIRGRDLGARPFTRVEEIRKAAERETLREQERLEEQVRQTQERIAQLRATTGEGQNGLLLSPQQQEELDGLRAQFVKSRKELRDVRLAATRDIDRLGVVVRVVNIVVVPAALALAGLGIAWVRSRERRALRGAVERSADPRIERSVP